MMTADFSIGESRQLYETLLRQRAIDLLSEPAGGVLARRRLLSAPRALMAHCVPLLCCSGSGFCWGKSSTMEQMRRLTQAGVDPVEAMQRLRVDLWQEALCRRVAMLRPLLLHTRGESIRSDLPILLHFLDAVCGLAHYVAPPDAQRPERVQMLLQLMPQLINASGPEDAYRSAHALVLAIRREWMFGQPGASHSSLPVLSSAEMEAIVNAVAKLVAVASAKHTVHSRHVQSLLAAPLPLSQRRREQQDGQPEERKKNEQVELEQAADMLDLADAQLADGPLLQCLVCGTPVLRASDVLSSDYRIMAGPGYLAEATYNVHFASETSEVVYTSGEYTVAEISCACCAVQLGILYVDATDAENNFKVGKMLLAQDQLFLPPWSVGPPCERGELQSHFLELLCCGTVVSAEPPPPMMSTPTLFQPGAGAHGGFASDWGSIYGRGDEDFGMPAVSRTNGGRVEVHEQHFVVTIRRYIRCMIPPVRYVLARHPEQGL
mmetsp:Transcript_201/g.854  ORF Transcript_201/g.854 Transcript_201/m.854 type:complete len:492 (+) Transcript_201:1220-2695(+)